MNIYGEPIEGSSLDNGGTITGDLEVTGDIECDNLTVTDTLTASTIITEQELDVKDPLITCGVDNPADSLNLGLLMEYNDGADKWTGFVRSKNDKNHYLIEATSKPTPSQNITLLDRGHLLANQMTVKANSDALISKFIVQNNLGSLEFQNSTGIQKYSMQHTASSDTLHLSGGAGANFMSLTMVGTTGEMSLDAATLTIGSGATEYSIPTTDGTANQILQTDGAGTVSWANSGGSDFNSLEASSGLFTGGGLSINADTTKFDIAAGTGQYVSGSTVTTTSWGAMLANGGPYTGTLTYVSLAPGDVVTISPTKPTPTQRRNNIFLGVLGTVNLTNVNDTSDTPVYLGNHLSQLNDLSESIGLINVSGNTISSNSLLTIAKSLGSIYNFGGNFSTSATNPSINSIPALDTNVADTFAYVYQDSSVVLSQTSVIPANYDDGNGAGSPGAVASNDWSTSRVYLNDVIMVIQPGQVVHNSLSIARSNLATENFVESSGVEANGVLIGYMIIRGGATDLSLAGDCLFVQAGKFGGSGSGAGTIDLQVAFDNSTVPQITTNATNTSLTLKSHNTSSNLLDCLDSADSSVFTVSAGGIIASPELDCDITNLETLNFKNTIGTTKLALLYRTANNSLILEDESSNTLQVTDLAGTQTWYDNTGSKLVEITSGPKLNVGDPSPGNGHFNVQFDGSCRSIMESNTDGVVGNVFQFNKSRGTRASRTDVVVDDLLGAYNFYGYYNGSYVLAAGLSVWVDDTWNGSIRKTRLTYASNDTVNNIERFCVSSDGEFCIGNSLGSSHYVYPKARGAAGQQLRSDGAGVLTWQNITPATTVTNAIPKYSGLTGLLTESEVIIDSSNNIAFPNYAQAFDISTPNAGASITLSGGIGAKQLTVDADAVTVENDLKYQQSFFHGYFYGNHPLTLTTQGTWQRLFVSAGFIAGADTNDFTVNTNGAYTYTGSRDKRCEVTATFSIGTDPTQAALQLEIAVFQNIPADLTLDNANGSQCLMFIGSNNVEAHTGSSHFYPKLTNGDTLAVYARSTSIAAALIQVRTLSFIGTCVDNVV